MNMSLDPAKLLDEQPVETESISECMPEFAKPTAEVGGASFPPIPTFKRLAISTGVAVLGTISAGSQAAHEFEMRGFSFSVVLPTGEDLAKTNLADRYSQIREEIVQSGLPQLSDEELRQEIRERRGIRAESEA